MTEYHLQFRPDEIPAQQTDYEQNAALRLQTQWLATEKVRKRVKALGWDHPIHWITNVTYRDVRDTPRYNWHKWMSRQIEEGKYSNGIHFKPDAASIIPIYNREYQPPKE